MIEYLYATMWVIISIKINRSIDESKVIIKNMYEKLQNDLHFNINDYDKTVIDAFNYYQECLKYLNKSYID